jgi:hypothetical protein
MEDVSDMAASLAKRRELVNPARDQGCGQPV